MKVQKEKRIAVVIRLKNKYKIKKSVQFAFTKLGLTTQSFESAGIRVSNLEEKVRLEHVRHIMKFANAFSTDIFSNDIKKISELPYVKRIEPVFRIRKTMNDVHRLINHPLISNNSKYAGKGIRVAILDTGIDDSHPDLRKKVVYRIDINGDGDIDAEGHGTHVAGIIAGSGEASNGKYKGIAPEASLLSIKVLGQNGKGRDDDLGIGIEEAMNQKADVINMSLGAELDEPPPWSWPNYYYLHEDIAKKAMKKGILVCAVAGNSGSGNGTIESPGRIEEVLTVGCTTKNNRIASFSSRGPVKIEGRKKEIKKPDVVAPGGDVDPFNECEYEPGIISCLANRGKSFEWYYWNFKEPCRVDNFYYKSSGTSMAAPVVAGLGALLFQVIREKQLNVKGSLSQYIKSKIMESCRDLGFDENSQGKGIIDVEQAIDLLN